MRIHLEYKSGAAAARSKIENAIRPSWQLEISSELVERPFD